MATWPRLRRVLSPEQVGPRTDARALDLFAEAGRLAQSSSILAKWQFHARVCLLKNYEIPRLNGLSHHIVSFFFFVFFLFIFLEKNV